MPKKPTSLSDALAKKAAAAPAADAPKAGTDRTVVMTLRLPVPVHDQLRKLAFEERTSQAALAMEGLNLLFVQRGLPPIAS